MTHGSKVILLGLFLLASSASAITVGPIKGKPVNGRPLEVNIPFAVDGLTDRACASANVRYGSSPVPRMTLDVQGHGLKRNLLVTSRAHVNEDTVTVNIRVGCGTKAVSRKFVMQTSTSVAKAALVAEPAPKRAAPEVAIKQAPKAVALMTPGEPLFPPPVPEATPHENPVHKADAPLDEELRKARADAATATAQLESTRKELNAVLDVVRRTSQTLINSDHQVRNAKSEVAHMRLVLQWVGAVLVLVAAGVVWFEFNRVTFRRRTSEAQAPQEPTILSGMEMQA